MKKILLILIIIIFHNSSLLFAHILSKYEKNTIIYIDFDEVISSPSFHFKDLSGNKLDAFFEDKLQCQEHYLNDGLKFGAAYFKKDSKVIVKNSKLIERFSEFSIMLWAKPYSLNGKSVLVAKHSYSSEFNYFLIGLDNDKIYSTIASNNEFCSTLKNTSLILNEWNHVALVFQNKTLTLFINGNVVDAAKCSFSFCETGLSSLSIGSDFEGNESFFNGLIDEFFIFDKAILAEDIKKEFDLIKYNLSIHKDLDFNYNKFLIAHFPINEGEGNLIKNLSMPNNPGYLTQNMENNWKSGFDVKSLLFKSSDDLIRINYYDKLKLNENFTIICWIKPFKFDKKCEILVKKDPDNKRFYSIGEHQGKAYGGIGDGNEINYVHSKNNLELNKWQQITFVCDLPHNKLSLLINDKIDNSKISNISSKTGDFPLIIGGLANSHFSGEIKEIKIFNVAISLNEIINNYNRINESLNKKTISNAEKSELRTKFYGALRELYDINEMLEINENIVFNFIDNQEKESLSKLQQHLNARKVIFELKKSEEIRKFDILTKSVNELINEINNSRKTKNLSPLEIITPKIGQYSTLLDIRAAVNKLADIEVKLISEQ